MVVGDLANLLLELQENRKLTQKKAINIRMINFIEIQPDGAALAASIEAGTATGAEIGVIGGPPGAFVGAVAGAGTGLLVGAMTETPIGQQITNQVVNMATDIGKGLYGGAVNTYRMLKRDFDNAKH